jgi:hypothetical protein
VPRSASRAAPNGTADFWVDDLLQMTVYHADGTISSYTADDSAACTADTVLATSPTSLNPYSLAGTNHVLVTFSDRCGATTATPMSTRGL